MDCTNQSINPRFVLTCWSYQIQLLIYSTSRQPRARAFYLRENLRTCKDFYCTNLHKKKGNFSTLPKLVLMVNSTNTNDLAQLILQIASYYKANEYETILEKIFLFHLKYVCFYDLLLRR